jgi:hypothetical protein
VFDSLGPETTVALTGIAIEAGKIQPPRRVELELAQVDWLSQRPAPCWKRYDKSISTMANLIVAPASKIVAMIKITCTVAGFASNQFLIFCQRFRSLFGPMSLRLPRL